MRSISIFILLVSGLWGLLLCGSGLVGVLFLLHQYHNNYDDRDNNDYRYSDKDAQAEGLGAEAAE